MPALYHRDSTIAFNEALESRFFNHDIHSEWFVENYMYTHSDEHGDHLNMQPPVNQLFTYAIVIRGKRSYAAISQVFLALFSKGLQRHTKVNKDDIHR